MVRGITQTALGKALGISFQQVQKYERGANRISASSLILMAQTLDVSVAAIFEGIAAEPTDYTLVLDHQAAQLVRDFNQIRSHETRAKLAQLIKELASGD
jgi:transcriptional regulator with XRE-family HTH domain